MMKLIKPAAPRGQIGLIVVLIMAVGLTIGLAIVSQSVTNVSISETEEKSLRAFNAAEAGIEEILRQPTVTIGASQVTVGDLQAQVNVTSKTDQRLVLKANETMEVPLEGATATQVKISWVDKNDLTQNPGTCSEGEGKAPASLEILWLRSISGQVVPYRYLYNACGDLDTANWFTTSSPDSEAGTDPYLSQVTFTDIQGDNTQATYDITMRIRTFYNQATLAVTAVGGGELPIQEYQLLSTATTDTGETRSVEVTKSVEAWPPIFDYVLFSGLSLVK